MAERGKWQLQAAVDSGAFSAPALVKAALRQAIAELKKTAKKQPLVAASAALDLVCHLPLAADQLQAQSFELGPLLEAVLGELAELIKLTAAEPGKQEETLHQLDSALQRDTAGVLSPLARKWGELCCSEQLASAWADRLMLRLPPDIGALLPNHEACFAALFQAQRWTELHALLPPHAPWALHSWTIRSLVAQAATPQALATLEALRARTSDADEQRAIAQMGEQILLTAGETETAYLQLALSSNRAGTNLATFRAIAKRYPKLSSERILTDLAQSTPGEEGKWFAAAKEAGLFELALQFARTSPCHTETLVRAARDFAEVAPLFAVEAGYLALHWLALNRGFEVTNTEVWSAYYATSHAAEHAQNWEATQQRIRQLVLQDQSTGHALRKALARELGM